MVPGSYSLATTVSFLEAMLNAVGYQPLVDVEVGTRESLRERFRKSVRLLNRFRAEQAFDQDSWSISTILTPGYAAGVLRHDQQRRLCEGYSRLAGMCCATGALSVYEVQAGTYGDRSGLPRFYDSQVAFDDLAVSTPVYAKAPPTLFDVAMRVAVEGITSVYAAVMDLWSCRHDDVPSATSKKQPGRRRALDRFFLALMRFAFGFFGSHKVDARNNP